MALPEVGVPVGVGNLYIFLYCNSCSSCNSCNSSTRATRAAAALTPHSLWGSGPQANANAGWVVGGGKWAVGFVILSLQLPQGMLTIAFMQNRRY